jgi:putative redox protein
MASTVTGRIGHNHYSTIIHNDRHELIADEPANHNGTDLGFNPEELLCSALTACTAITLRMYADRKEWQVEEIKVSVQIERDAAQNITNVKRDITITGQIDEVQRARMLAIANQCPIHKILSNPIHIDTTLSI